MNADLYNQQEGTNVHEIRDFCDVGVHVTSRHNADLIISEGFRSSTSQFGPGSYFSVSDYGNAAEMYAQLAWGTQEICDITAFICKVSAPRVMHLHATGILLDECDHEQLVERMTDMAATAAGIEAGERCRPSTIALAAGFDATLLTGDYWTNDLGGDQLIIHDPADGIRIVDIVHGNDLDDFIFDVVEHTQSALART